MIIVDNALRAREQQGKPIRVGMVGAGFMGQGLTNQITHSVPGMRMAAVYNRRPERAQHVYRYSGLDNFVMAGTQSQLDEAVRRGQPVVAEDPFLMCRSSGIDVIVDVTGSVEFGAHVILEAFKHGMPPHGGFGLGLERLTKQMLGLENVKQASLLPRDRNRLTP